MPESVRTDWAGLRLISSCEMSSIAAPDIRNPVDKARANAKAFAAGVPWYVWCAVAAVTSADIGAHWDISWHLSIGRDTFLTPAHIAIYLCGVLAGIAFGYIILSTTFRRNAPLAESSVHILGLRAPLGAFIASWGGVAMLTSAPFDNWWHDAYGLDVTIVSPPHLVLFTGVYAVLIGTLVLIAGTMNRATGAAKTLPRNLYLYVGGITTVAAMVLIMEFIGRTWQHNSLPYILVSTLVLIVMTSTSRATGFRFAATILAAFYTLFLIGLIQILPLFPAEPKLGPVYQHVTHFIPPQFPLLLIVPAVLLDLFWRWSKSWNAWVLSITSALLFVLSLLAVQYPFASFLMTPAARNSFFGTGYLPYGAQPLSALARNVFYVIETPAQFWMGIGLAVVLGTLAVRFGLSRGQWMSQVQR